MLATILKTKVAAEVSISIMDVFVKMRKYISNNLLEQEYINNMVLKHDSDINILKSAFNKFKPKNNEIFFNGQIYDVYSKIVYNNTFHDRYIIIDEKIIYHCGASINNAGNKTFSINLLEDEFIVNSLINNIKDNVNT